MLILHGDNLIQSRQALQTELDKARAGGTETERVDAKKLTEAKLEEILGSSDLFDTDKMIIIEGLHSLPRSKKKTALIKMAAGAERTKIILWEKRSLTKTMLKQFTGAEQKEFKSSSSLFKWLDLLGSNNQGEKLRLLAEAIESDGEYFCFLMLLRQIRMMIQAKDGGKIAGPPFVVQKVQGQARNFTLEKLLSIHHQLYKLDRRHKTSKSPLSLGAELDLLTLAL